MRPALLLLLAAACAAACARGSDAATAPRLEVAALAYVPGDTWRHAAPADLAMDGHVLDDLVARIRAGAYGTQHSLMIVKNGWVVTEEYFNAWPADTIHTMQSVTGATPVHRAEVRPRRRNHGEHPLRQRERGDRLPLRGHPARAAVEGPLRV